MKPSASSVIASLTMEELKAYCEVPDDIDLRLMERADVIYAGPGRSVNCATRTYNLTS